MIEKLFYLRNDLKNDHAKLKIYNRIFTIIFPLGLLLVIVSIIPPMVPFGIAMGSFCAITSGYFLLSIHIKEVK